MNSKIDAIFFDWGGVIADDPGDEFLAMLLRKLGATEQQVEEIFETYMLRFMKGEITEARYWQELGDHYGFTIHDTISEEFIHWRGLIKNEAILALVDRAKAQGLKTALLTNVIEPTYNVLQNSGSYDHFGTVIASCKVGMAKPEPEIYAYALKALGTTADKSLFIDDKQKNLDPAIGLGFHTILAERPDQIIRDLEAYLA